MTPEECQAWAKAFSPRLQEILFQRQQKSWSDAEFVARYLEVGFATADLLNKGSKWQAPASLAAHSGPLQIWSTNIFRGLPLSVHRSLLAWHQGFYPLHLCEHIPTTEEVLHWQTRGERCVTCVTDEALLATHILNERDPLSFVLHDLIHADHFFEDPVMAQVQVGFSRLMKQLIETTEVQSLRQQDETFCREFDYGATDMNSHGAHLLKYLKAIFVFALERQEIQNTNQFLKSLFEKITLEQQVNESFLRLNSKEESTTDFQKLQDFLFLKGAAASQDQEHRGVVIGHFASV